MQTTYTVEIIWSEDETEARIEIPSSGETSYIEPNTSGGYLVFTVDERNHLRDVVTPGAHTTDGAVNAAIRWLGIDPKRVEILHIPHEEVLS